MITEEEEMAKLDLKFSVDRLYKMAVGFGDDISAAAYYTDLDMEIYAGQWELCPSYVLLL